MYEFIDISHTVQIKRFLRDAVSSEKLVHAAETKAQTTKKDPNKYVKSILLTYNRETVVQQEKQKRYFFNNDLTLKSDQKTPLDSSQKSDTFTAEDLNF